jgi:hypothetical protein
MVKVNYTELSFDHLVIFEKDKTIFAAARENGNAHLRIFLIYDTTGSVYTRNGRADSWEALSGNDRDAVLAGVIAARSRVPVYTINGSHTIGG